jgi:hypothetical protein
MQLGHIVILSDHDLSRYHAVTLLKPHADALEPCTVTFLELALMLRNETKDE